MFNFHISFMGHWVELNHRERIKNFLMEKFDVIKNNKRGVVYTVTTVGSGVAGYAFTGSPLMAVGCSVVSEGACILHAFRSLDKGYERQRYSS
jgi:hypothetical protein